MNDERPIAIAIPFKHSGTPVPTKHWDPCRDRCHDEEPIFTLRAQDAFAVYLIRRWVKRAKREGIPEEKWRGAQIIGNAMEAYQRKHGKKIPD